MSGITVSKEHGVNPSLLVCPFCREEEYGLAICGRLPGDKEAPKRMRGDEPCDKCKELMEKGIYLIVHTDAFLDVTDDRKLSADEVFWGESRTGHTIVITEDCVRRIGKHFKMGDERIDLAIKMRLLVIPESLASQMLSDSKVAE